MTFFSSLLYYLFIIPISVLPFPLLYGISDVLFYLFYYVIGYRKDVVLGNIRNSFPEKSAAEHREICKKFYRHFCDLVLESLKAFTISETEVKKRMVIRNTDIMDRYFKEKRSVIIATGHYNNWEFFVLALAAPLQHKAIAIYKPLTNPFFDKKMLDMRTKFGLRMVSTRGTKRAFEEEKNNLTATAFGFDQSPLHADKAHWMQFMNQDTGVMIGTERFAKDYNFPVVYCHVRKDKRGYYSFWYSEACDQPRATAPAEITERITRMLEAEIMNQPEYYLWTHRRWKQKRPEKVISLQKLS
jgi:KDO2-lipid IV(A) lauroyltransferase